MPRLPVVGSDQENWGSLLNEFLQVSHRENGLTKNSTEVFNVEDYGAIGDGKANDTEAVRQAIHAVESAPFGGVIYFPSGKYRITETLLFTVRKPLEIRGNGWSSEVLWAFDGHLFRWNTGVPCREVTMADLKITSVEGTKSPESAAVICDGGVEKSYFDHLLINSSGGTQNKSFPGSGLVFNGVSDSTAFHQCLFWEIRGTGIRIGHGSEIRIEGGRIIGTAARNDGSIGVHLTGNNGGVHLVTTDVIGLDEGVRIENLGAGSNREVMFTHSTLDSCGSGLELRDATYVSMIGCWAASCVRANMHIAASGRGARLVVSGGTIFNAGAWGGNKGPDTQNGLVVEAGTFVLTGVSIWANRGIGIWVPQGSSRDFAITGCQVINNGQGVNIQGTHYMLANNVFGQNKTPNRVEGTGFIDANNLTK